MSKLPTGGYQPTNRPENLIPPNKGPSYKPKEEKSKVIWHPYPEEKPIEKGDYLVTIRSMGDKLRITSIDYYDKSFDYDDLICAWAELPEPYKGNYNG